MTTEEFNKVKAEIKQDMQLEKDRFLDDILRMATIFTNNWNRFQAKIQNFDAEELAGDKLKKANDK